MIYESIQAPTREILRGVNLAMPKVFHKGQSLTGWYESIRALTREILAVFRNSPHNDPHLSNRNFHRFLIKSSYHQLSSYNPPQRDKIKVLSAIVRRPSLYKWQPHVIVMEPYGLALTSATTPTNY